MVDEGRRGGAGRNWVGNKREQKEIKKKEKEEYKKIMPTWKRIGSWLFGDIVRYMEEDAKIKPTDSEFEKIIKEVGNAVKESNKMLGGYNGVVVPPTFYLIGF